MRAVDPISFRTLPLSSRLKVHRSAVDSGVNLRLTRMPHVSLTHDIVAPGKWSRASKDIVDAVASATNEAEQDVYASIHIVVASAAIVEHIALATDRSIERSAWGKERPLGWAAGPREGQKWEPFQVISTILVSDENCTDSSF